MPQPESEIFVDATSESDGNKAEIQNMINQAEGNVDHFSALYGKRFTMVPSLLDRARAQHREIIDRSNGGYLRVTGNTPSGSAQ